MEGENRRNKGNMSDEAMPWGGWSGGGGGAEGGIHLRLNDIPIRLGYPSPPGGEQSLAP